MGSPIHARRVYNSVVLFPRLLGTTDTLLRVGGQALGRSSDFAEQCRPLASAPTNQSWSALPPLHYPRTESNLVILPDASLLMVGGVDEDHPTLPDTPRKVPELFADGQWSDMTEETSARSYHSVALLLPDGRVLSAGSEDRSWDYQIFEPPYLTCGGTRPRIVSMQAPFDPNDGAFVLDYNTPIVVDVGAEGGDALPLGTTIDHAFLVAPGAITHHSDMHQRLVEVAFDPLAVPEEAGQWQLKTPIDDKVCPHGFYMLFVVTNHGIPSVATWVRL